MSKCKCHVWECQRGCTDKCLAENVYHPSNGTEGSSFVEEYCMNCLHCDPDPNGYKQCELLCASLCFHPTEKEYPLEWIYENNQPKCTKWVKWDWNNDGDPDDPENPKAPPPPPDPNQLDLFPLYPDERVGLKMNLHTFNEKRPTACTNRLLPDVVFSAAGSQRKSLRALWLFVGKTMAGNEEGYTKRDENR